MKDAEVIGLIIVLLLALYGCVQFIRRLCLWACRCPRCVQVYRLAIPSETAAIEPLMRCLQAQAVWDEQPCCRTLLLLPEDGFADPTLDALLQETPAVVPLTAARLADYITAQKDERKEP